nr:MAG TPA: hypothetical protein [Caudoviricetes sp.]
MANKMGIIHYFLIKIETEGKTIMNYKSHIDCAPEFQKMH